MDRGERVMLEALCLNQGLTQWVDCFSVGSNEGGKFASLFSSRAKFRICVVYEERFRGLPDFVQAAMPADGDFGGETTTEREREEKAGRLHKCQPFQIARWQIGDEEKSKWRFHGVVRVLKEKAAASPMAESSAAPVDESEPAAKPEDEKGTGSTQGPLASKGAASRTPVAASPTGDATGRDDVKGPVFRDKKGAIAWAVRQGAYVDMDEGTQAYEELKRAQKPQSAPVMFALWVSNTQELLAKR